MNNNKVMTTGHLPELLIISTFPPRECGIATYSNDLTLALEAQFGHSFRVKICAIESDADQYQYEENVAYRLNVDKPDDFVQQAIGINNNPRIQLIVVQHEFGFFAKVEAEFHRFLESLNKQIVVVFHTMLPKPEQAMRQNVRKIASLVDLIVVMTQSSEDLLVHDYGVQRRRIRIIPHGTHLLPGFDQHTLKAKHQLGDKKVLTTFGFLSAGKGIETTLEAIPEILKEHPDMMFLIVGKTHPSVLKNEGERYRTELTAMVERLQIQPYVTFVNSFVPLPDLLEYLNLTDIYLFTSKDPYQAVSGTFSYAISCGCAMVSTPIPHAREVLQRGMGVLVDFGSASQLASAVKILLSDDQLRKQMGVNGLHRMASTSWPNTAIAYARVFEKMLADQWMLGYRIPPINLKHLKRMTTDVGIIQFSNLGQPDIESGYTLDDNARALIAFCTHYKQTAERDDLLYISQYLNFLAFCQQPDGRFLNYVDKDRSFTSQNAAENLDDSNGRAIWALGFLLSIKHVLPEPIVQKAELLFQKSTTDISRVYSERAISFAIKGLYYFGLTGETDKLTHLVSLLAGRLVKSYRRERTESWYWFESYLTYANGVIPEAMLMAWRVTGVLEFKDIARESFDFLLSRTFKKNAIKVVSNKDWLHVGNKNPAGGNGGEQPIDVAYTTLALACFDEDFVEAGYRARMTTAFSWFLGNNHLSQIVYNPSTGGCYDGIEEHNVNLNQGAESTLCYLLARLSIAEGAIPMSGSAENQAALGVAG